MQSLTNSFPSERCITQFVTYWTWLMCHNNRLTGYTLLPCTDDSLLHTVSELHCRASAPSPAAELQENVPLLSTTNTSKLNLYRILAPFALSRCDLYIYCDLKVIQGQSLSFNRQIVLKLWGTEEAKEDRATRPHQTSCCFPSGYLAVFTRHPPFFCSYTL